MIEIKFKDCCQNCASRNTYLKEDSMYAINRVVEVYTAIGCEHELVCKQYIEDELQRSMDPTLNYRDYFLKYLAEAKARLEDTND